MFTRRQSISALVFAAITIGNVHASDLPKTEMSQIAHGYAHQSVLEVSQQVTEELSMDVLHDIHTASHQFETDAQSGELMAEVTIRSFEPAKKNHNNDA